MPPTTTSGMGLTPPEVRFIEQRRAKIMHLQDAAATLDNEIQAAILWVNSATSPLELADARSDLKRLRNRRSNIRGILKRMEDGRV